MPEPSHLCALLLRGRCCCCATTSLRWVIDDDGGLLFDGSGFAFWPSGRSGHARSMGGWALECRAGARPADGSSMSNAIVWRGHLMMMICAGGYDATENQAAMRTKSSEICT